MSLRKWKGSILLNAEKWPEELSGPGVYRIRGFNATGKPIIIHRCLGRDREGILAFGESKNLYRRLKEFWRRAQGKSAAHAEAAEYADGRFDNFFPFELLHFDYILTADKEKAEVLEINLFNEYRYSFLDSPPLNKSRGKRWKHSQ